MPFLKFQPRLFSVYFDSLFYQISEFFRLPAHYDPPDYLALDSMLMENETQIDAFHFSL